MDVSIDAKRLRITGVAELEDGTDGRVIDEKAWRDQCLDLHKVMSICKNLYLVLEHNSEALLRVGVEMVTDRSARKCLWWHDGWYADEGKHDWFRSTVRAKLKAAIASVKGCQVDIEEFGDKTDEEESAALRIRLEQAEAARANAEKQQKIAEMQCRKAEEAMAQAQEEAAVFQKTIEQLRNEIKRMQEDINELSKNQGKSDDAKVAALNQQLQMKDEAMKKLEAELNQLREVSKNAASLQEVLQVTSNWFESTFGERLCSGLTGDAKTAKRPDLGETKSNLEKFTKKYNDLQKQLEDAIKKANAPRPAAPVAAAPKAQPKKEEPKPIEIPKDVGPELRAALEKYEAEANLRREAEDRLNELQALFKQLKDELEAEKQKSAAAEKRAADAQERANRLELEADSLREALAKKGELPPPPAPKPVVDAPVEKGIPPELLAELEELRQIKAKCEKLESTLARLREMNKKLAEENDSLRARNDKLLKTLHEVKEQLKRVMEIAEKKGYGKLVQEIMDEANLTETLNSPEFTCFDRLYEDAVRRQNKQRNIEEMRLGLRPRGFQETQQGILVRGAGGIIGYASDYEEAKRMRAQAAGIGSRADPYVMGSYGYGGAGIHMDNNGPGSFGGVPRFGGFMGQGIPGGPTLTSSDFDKMDKDGDGMISRKEFEAFLGKMATGAAATSPVDRPAASGMPAGGSKMGGEMRRILLTDESPSHGVETVGIPPGAGATWSAGFGAGGRSQQHSPGIGAVGSGRLGSGGIGSSLGSGQSASAGNLLEIRGGGKGGLSRARTSPALDHNQGKHVAFAPSDANLTLKQSRSDFGVTLKASGSGTLSPIRSSGTGLPVREGLPPSRQDSRQMWTGSGTRNERSGTAGFAGGRMGSPQLSEQAGADTGMTNRRPVPQRMVMDNMPQQMVTQSLQSEPSSELPRLATGSLLSSPGSVGGGGFVSNSGAGHRIVKPDVLQSSQGPGGLRGTMFATLARGGGRREGSPDTYRVGWRSTPSRGQLASVPDLMVGSKGGSYLPGATPGAMSEWGITNSRIGTNIGGMANSSSTMSLP